MGTHSSEAMISRSAILGSAILALSAAEEIPFLETALQVVSRASTSSEVLSLNLTNLIILIALKVSLRPDHLWSLFGNIKSFACVTYDTRARWWNVCLVI